MKKIKGLTLALGLSLLLVPSGAKADKLTDPYIPKIESGDILPPQYIGTDNKLIKDKIPSKEEWIKSVESQVVGGGGKTLLISKKKKTIKIKKTDKKGKPLEGVQFKMYANKEDALNDENVLDTQTTNKDGIATFENDIYYGRYIKESQTIEKYQIRDKEKDIISVYRDNGVRFLGEMTPGKMKVTSINQNRTEKTLDSNKNINEELQDLVKKGKSFNHNTNWLVFNDNGKEKLVSKKPLKHSISWRNLQRSYLVFGQKEIPEGYIPTYVTINNKRYIVRLIRAYNDDTPINDRSSTFGQYDRVKGSEWNRLILPLINPTGDNKNTGYDNGINGRYGSETKDYVESNMPTLANYSWWTDFGGNNNSSGNYSKGSDYGAYRWAQETGYDGSSSRTLRGSSTYYYGAGNAGVISPYDNTIAIGWLPVLELVN